VQDKINKLKEDAKQLEELLSEFPDLHEYRGRWRTFLVSKKVNENPEKCYTSHACGCCGDSPLQAWFYSKRNGKEIYSDPPYVYVGDKNPYYDYSDDSQRDIWDENWRDNVKNKISEAALKLIGGDVNVRQ